VEGGKTMRGFLATTLLLLSAAVLSSRAGVVPSNKQVVDTLHQVLTAATKETGLRLKRSTSEEWDKELDLSAIGALFRAKFDNKERPDQGGKVQIKFPGSRFIRNAPFDDVDLKVDYDGSRLQEGLLELKIDYSFVQKTKNRADVPRQGSVSLIRSLESGEWRTKLVIKRASHEQPLEHLLDLSFKSASKPNPQSQSRLCDFMTSCDIIEFSSVLDYKVGNYFDLKGKVFPGEKANIDLTVNGFVYSVMAELDPSLMKLSFVATYESRSFYLDFDVNPGEELGLAVKGNLGTPFEAKLVMQPDLTLGQLKISHDGQAIAFAQMKGQASAGERGLAVSYVVKYHVGSQAGKAKIDLTGRLPYCSLSINLVPTVERAIEHHFVMGFELSKAEGTEIISYNWDVQLEGASVQKVEGRWVKDLRDNLHYNLTTEDRVEQTKENPFFEIVNSFYGTELSSSKKTQRIFISQTEMDEILNNQIVQLRVNKVLLEEEYTVNGQTRHHFKYDNRAPRAEYFLRYAPQDHPEAEWWFAGSREVGDNSVELNHKITHGTSVVQKGMIKFDSQSTLPEVAVKYVQEVTTSPESPVYPLIEMMLGRHGSKIVQTGSLDTRMNLKNFKLATELTVDEEKISEVLIDNYNTGLKKVSIKRVWSPDAFGTNHEVAVDWEPNTSVSPKTGLDFALIYKRGGQPILSYTNKASWQIPQSDRTRVTREVEEKALTIDTDEELTQTEDSPLYSWGPTLQGKYWKEAKRTMQLRVEPNHFTLSELFLQDETVLDGELYRLVKIAWRNHDNEELDITWEQPGSGGLLPTTRDVFNQDKVNFAAKTEHRKPAEGDFYTAIVLTSNLPTLQNLTASYEIIPSGDIIDLIAKLVLNDKDLVTFRTDHTDNSAKLIVSPPGGEETVVSIAIPGLQYPAFPETFFDPFPSSEPTPPRILVFNVTRGQDRVDAILSGVDNLIYGHSMFEPQSIGLDVSGHLPTLGIFRFSRETTFQVFGEPERISTYKIQWSGHDEVSKGDLAAFSPMDTMVVVELNDTDGDSSLESFLKTSSIQAYKTFGGKRWGFTISKDNFAIITGVN